MSYITKDKRVRKILRETPDEKMARQLIKDLPPQADSSMGYLDWEVDEALRERP